MVPRRPIPCWKTCKNRSRLQSNQPDEVAGCSLQFHQIAAIQGFDGDVMGTARKQTGLFKPMEQMEEIAIWASSYCKLGYSTNTKLDPLGIPKKTWTNDHTCVHPKNGSASKATGTQRSCCKALTPSRTWKHSGWIHQNGILLSCWCMLIVFCCYWVGSQNWLPFQPLIFASSWG